MKKYYGRLTYSAWIDGSGWQLKDSFAGVDDLETSDVTEIRDWSREEFISYLLSPNDYNALDLMSDDDIKKLANKESGKDTLYKWCCECYDTETDEREHEDIHEVWASELARIYLANKDEIINDYEDEQNRGR